MIPSGRGAAMQRFLAVLREEEGGRSTNDGEQPEEARPVGREVPTYRQEENITQGMREIAIARPTGRGRGLQCSLNQAPMGRSASLHDRVSQGPYPGSSSDTPSAPAEPVIGGRGRSALMAAFFAQQRAEELSAPGRPSAAGPSGESPLSRPSPVSRDIGVCLERGATSFKTPPSRESPALRHSPSIHSSSYRSKELAPDNGTDTEENGPIIRKGAEGKEIPVVCNYINLDVEPGKGVFDYDLSFNPPEDNISMRTRMLNQHLDELGGAKTYNGVRLLLPIKLNNQKSFKCEHPASGTPVTMTLNCKGSAKARDAADLYNMLFRRIMGHLGLKNMGRKFFDPSGAVNIPQHRLEVWPGYVTGVQRFEGGIQLCCDASHRVMRTDTVLQVMEQLTARGPESYRAEITKVVLGAVVLTRYNNKVYKIDDIGWDQNPLSTFQDSSGEEISFADYYKSHYDIQLTDLRQPLLITRVERKQDLLRGGPQEVRLICLIPELCYITGLTDAMRADFRVMKDLTEKLQLTPSQRYEGLCKFLDNVKSNKQSQELLYKWGLRVSNAPIRLIARVLPEETIIYSERNAITLKPGASSWVVNNELFCAKSLHNWAVLFVGQDKVVADNFAKNMRSACAQMSMEVRSANMILIQDNRNESFLHTLRSTIQPGLQLVVIFFPSLRSDRYAAVKKVCCIEKPISSQVIQSRTLSKPDKARSITKKIAMQINCKLGGALWGLKIPYAKLMVCGMDVYHGAGGTKNVSVMGFVATSDPLQTTWYSRVGFGGDHQELSDNLRLCMLGALKKYMECNGFLPDRIIMYRDGVSDGQLRMTKEFEVPQMILSFENLMPNYKPKLTVVVCQKRITTRLLSIHRGSGHNMRLQNPPPGLVMDHTITRYDWYDFFLVSQSSNRGTVSPTHYVVVHDDGRIAPDHIQRMTYKMTHLYYNWTGTISVPAPAQYAHRLAQLVGLHLRKDPSSMLNDKLYFL